MMRLRLTPPEAVLNPAGERKEGRAGPGRGAVCARPALEAAGPSTECTQPSAQPLPDAKFPTHLT